MVLKFNNAIGGKQMRNKCNCLVCGDELEYSLSSYKQQCYYCKEEKYTNAQCKNGHFVCDNCHSANAYEIIERYCISSKLRNPLKMAMDLMVHPAVKMHGPEHHFLVPAVLITAYYNCLNEHSSIQQKLLEAKSRAKNVLGGFCGFYGNCGAAVGTGIFMSIITDATPLSKREWSLCNLMTANSLKSIAEHGGPRCCKRDSFLAIKEAIKFTKENTSVSMEDVEAVCIFSQLNSQCLKEECIFFNTK